MSNLRFVEKVNVTSWMGLHWGSDKNTKLNYIKYILYPRYIQAETVLKDLVLFLWK